ncbi:MAG: NADH-quinone oxidoreductase subunit D [Bacteroidota bacterium]|nr:NADH-quinone oxidoreductase subunit D [Bacteroidota bacterium]MDP4232954.1 NADH-quinone oxidoreductase subunit D [Bacteroidota bacterium]MDP4241998.1 NADH-quinone oxidoreductase subunit D [Bacteroidota bacterium]MDP4286901.1 NADH-quinone oxidoreductase subunit D [Bacteroidota bacterium]
MPELLERRALISSSSSKRGQGVADPNRLRTEEMVLNMGPQHPSTHGVLRLEVVLDGEVVVDVIPHLGYLHRCFEKHAEHMTYPQVIPYVDRMDYIAAMSGEHGYVVAVERMMNIEVPEKVEYIRVLFAELQRIASHLIAIGTYGLDAGAFTPFLYCFRDRETILEMFEKTCGARFLYNYMWVGGVSQDLHKDVLPMCREFVKVNRKTHTEINELLTFNHIFVQRTAGIGVLDPQVAVNAGASGPMLRSTGVKWDVRKNDPYSIYDRFDFEIAVGSDTLATLGDAFNRHWVRMLEWEQSLNIIEQILEQYPENDATDVQSAIPRRLKPPVGEIYSRTETPRGELGYYIVSRGDVKPWRVKVRSPAFANLSILPIISRGYLVADLVVILGSIDIVLGEVDR